jgi:RNA polymerase sigma-70 factor, ECF subfamily
VSRSAKSARRQRETYVGPWLPDPVLEKEDEADVTLPLMLALERLSPLERAAFLLHDVFGLEFGEVAATIQRDAAACRQLAGRAPMSARQDRASRWRNNAASSWRKRPSPPRAAAT